MSDSTDPEHVKLARDWVAKYERNGYVRPPSAAVTFARAVLAQHAQIAELERELERWRHGHTIEGDFVCPDSLRMTELEAALTEALDIAATPDSKCTEEQGQRLAELRKLVTDE